MYSDDFLNDKKKQDATEAASCFFEYTSWYYFPTMVVVKTNKIVDLGTTIVRPTKHG